MYNHLQKGRDNRKKAKLFHFRYGLSSKAIKPETGINSLAKK